MKDFLTDVTALCENARTQMNLGPVTDVSGVDLPRVLYVLNQALATELLCVLRYRRHYFAAKRSATHLSAVEFLQHSSEERAHADMIATRIAQLGGDPDFTLETLGARSNCEFDESDQPLDLIAEDLIAERITIASYSEVISWLGAGDPTTRRMLEDILAAEEEHAEDMLELLDGFKLPLQVSPRDAEERAISRT